MLCLRKCFLPYGCFKRLLTYDPVPSIPVFDLDHCIADLCSSSMRQAQGSALFRDRSMELSSALTSYELCARIGREDCSSQSELKPSFTVRRHGDVIHARACLLL